MGAIALTVAGIGLGAAGTGMQASSASKKRKELSQTTNSWLPDIAGDQARYFQDLGAYQPKSAELARTIGEDDMTNALALRERAMPGIGGFLSGALNAAGPMAGGQIPSWLQDIFKSSAGAGAVGRGFGGSPFGAGLTGWGSVDRAMGAQQQGVGLLGALMRMQPNISAPSSGAFLGALETPGQRTGTQMQVRGQNLQVASQLAQMETGQEVWGGFLGDMGGMMAGAGMGMMGGGGGGGAKTFSTGLGPTGDWWSPTTQSPGNLPGADRLQGGGWWSRLWGG